MNRKQYICPVLYTKLISPVRLMVGTTYDVAYDPEDGTTDSFVKEKTEENNNSDWGELW